MLSFGRGKEATEKLATETQKKTVWKETGHDHLLDQPVPLVSTPWVCKPETVVTVIYYRSSLHFLVATLCLLPLN